MSTRSGLHEHGLLPRILILTTFALGESGYDALSAGASGFVLKDDAEIGERLVISDSTANSHITHILGKLGLRDRAQLIVLAHQAGLVDSARP